MKKASKSRGKARLVVVAIILVLGGLSYPLLRFGFEVIEPEVAGYFRRIPFDPSIWQDEKRVYSDEAARKRMLPSLLGTHALVGQTPEQVRTLLGPPMERSEYTYYAERLEGIAPNEMVYWIGPEEGFMAFDSLWLILTPGKSGTIDHYRVTHAGIKEVRNPDCERRNSLLGEILRIDGDNNRLFVDGSSDYLDNQDKAFVPINLIRAYVAKCHPAWGQRWNASFFADGKFAGYKDEQLPEVMKDGSWAKAYLAVSMRT